MASFDARAGAGLPWGRVAVVALDLDGTLLRSDGTASPRTVAALQRMHRAGVRLVAATGRRPAAAARVMPAGVPLSGQVCNNGGEVRLDGKSIYQSTIGPEQARSILSYFTERWPDGLLTMVAGDRLYANKPVPDDWDGEVADLMEMVYQPVYKFLLDCGALDGSDAIQDALPPGCRMIVFSDGRWAEIVPDSISKAAGLALLVESWGLTLGDVLCFGDDMNDVEMVAQCGIGVAMGNAAPAVKAVADLVAPATDDDGIAVVLETYLADKLRA